jgi:hypothetical protein
VDGETWAELLTGQDSRWVVVDLQTPAQYEEEILKIGLDSAVAMEAAALRGTLRSAIFMMSKLCRAGGNA